MSVSTIDCVLMIMPILMKLVLLMMIILVMVFMACRLAE